MAGEAASPNVDGDDIVIDRRARSSACVRSGIMKFVEDSASIRTSQEDSAPLLDRIFPGGRPLFDWMRSASLPRLRRRLADEIEGFRRHDWSGQLYLIVNAVVAAVSIPGALAFTVFGVLSADSPAELVFSVLAGGLAVWLGSVYLRVLSGVARFGMRARRIAMFFLVLGLLGGLVGLDPDRPIHEKVVALMEAALAAQFLVYFVRNRARFLSRGELHQLDRVQDPAVSMSDAGRRAGPSGRLLAAADRLDRPFSRSLLDRVQTLDLVLEPAADAE